MAFWFGFRSRARRMADFLRQGMQELDQARKDADAVAKAAEKAAEDAALLAAAAAAEEAKKAAAEATLLATAAAAEEAKRVIADAALLQQAADAEEAKRTIADAALLQQAADAEAAKRVIADAALLQQAATAADASAVAAVVAAASTPIHNKAGVFENLGTSTVSGTTVTVNLNSGNFFQMDLQGLSGNVTTFTISNATQEDNMVSCFIVKIIQGSTNRNFTWSSITNIDWAGGEGPDITTGNDKVDILSFTTYNKGSTWYGAPVGQEFS